MSASARRRISLAQKARWAKGERSRAETPAHDISSGQKENRGGTKGTVGEAEGWEEIGGRSSMGSLLLKWWAPKERIQLRWGWSRMWDIACDIGDKVFQS